MATMRIATAVSIVAAAPALATADATGEGGSPLAKVIEMLSGLQGKIIHEGEVAHKDYESYAEWCEDTSKDLHYEINAGESTVADLKATITKESATIESLGNKIDDLAAKAASAEKDLKAVSEVRKKEAADFKNADKELQQTMSALKRAQKVLSGGGASLMQYDRTKDVVQALGAMVQASAINAADGERLTALVQNSASTEDEGAEAGAPAAAAYENQSGGILEVLEGLQDKAEEQLADARKAETEAQENFQLLRQSLEDEASVAQSEIEEAKNNVAASTEAKTVAQGDLDVTSKDLAEDKKSLDDAHATCQKTAEDYEAGTKNRNEELEALAQAKKIVQEVAGGNSESLALGQVSFLEVGSTQGEPRAVVRFMLDLARKEDSKSLAQLAHRISSTIKLKAARGQDPFAKVKGLITEMITKLENEAGADATHKAYCDKENRESTEKKDDKAAEIEKLDTAIDKASSRVAVLEEETTQLTKELASIAKSQAGYDEWMQETEETFNSNAADMEDGVKGVQLAIKVLKDYYANNDSSAEGAAGGIVGLLETVEADFTKALSEMKSAFENQKAAHHATTQENELATTAKNQDLKYKRKETIDLQKALKETTADRNGVQTELDAINVYLSKIAEQCVEKAEPYEEVKARRDAEITGLREGLQVLEGEAVLLQSGSHSSRRSGLMLSRH